MAAVQPKQVNWWYHALADWMLLNPEKNLGLAAKEFGVTQSWLSVIKNSDAFKAYFQERSKNFSDKKENAVIAPLLGVREKTAAVAEAALDEIAERLERQSAIFAMKDLMAIAKLEIDKKGYGSGVGGPPVNVQVNVNSVSRGELEAARERLHTLVGGVAPRAELAAPSASPDGSLAPAHKQLELKVAAE